MICTNDLLIIIGSIIKQLIESKSIVGDMWDVCSLMLGENILLSSLDYLSVVIVVQFISFIKEASIHELCQDIDTYQISGIIAIITMKTCPYQALATFWCGLVFSDTSASSKLTTS